MPITIQCTCGKVFKVKDEMAGTDVTCQICGAVTPAVSASGPTTAVAVGNMPIPKAPPTIEIQTGAVAEKMMACPACAEQISARSKRCPLCKEAIEGTVSEEDRQTLLQETIQSVEAYLQDDGLQERDDVLKGSMLILQTKILGALAALCLVSIAYGLLISDGAAFVGLGLVLGIIFVTAALVSFIRDKATFNIQAAATPDVAVKGFLTAISSGRSDRAFAALAPTARKKGRVQNIKLNNKNLPCKTGSYVIKDPASFKEYWSSIFSGPSGHNRTVTVKNVRTVTNEGDDGVAVVEGELHIASHPQWIIITFLISLLVVVILMLVLRQKDVKKFRKTLIRRGDKWFFAEGELEGLLDTRARPSAK